MGTARLASVLGVVLVLVTGVHSSSFLACHSAADDAVLSDDPDDTSARIALCATLQPYESLKPTPNPISGALLSDDRTLSRQQSAWLRAWMQTATDEFEWVTIGEVLGAFHPNLDFIYDVHVFLMTSPWMETPSLQSLLLRLPLAARDLAMSALRAIDQRTSSIGAEIRLYLLSLLSRLSPAELVLAINVLPCRSPVFFLVADAIRLLPGSQRTVVFKKLSRSLLHSDWVRCCVPSLPEATGRRQLRSSLAKGAPVKDYLRQMRIDKLFQPENPQRFHQQLVRFASGQFSVEEQTRLGNLPRRASDTVEHDDGIDLEEVLFGIPTAMLLDVLETFPPDAVWAMGDHPKSLTLDAFLYEIGVAVLCRGRPVQALGLVALLDRLLPLDDTFPASCRTHLWLLGEDPSDPTSSGSQTEDPTAVAVLALLNRAALVEELPYARNLFVLALDLMRQWGTRDGAARRPVLERLLRGALFLDVMAADSSLLFELVSADAVADVFGPGDLVDLLRHPGLQHAYLRGVRNRVQAASWSIPARLDDDPFVVQVVEAIVPALSAAGRRSAYGQLPNSVADVVFQRYLAQICNLAVNRVRVLNLIVLMDVSDFASYLCNGRTPDWAEIDLFSPERAQDVAMLSGYWCQMNDDPALMTALLERFGSFRWPSLVRAMYSLSAYDRSARVLVTVHEVLFHMLEQAETDLMPYLLQGDSFDVFRLRYGGFLRWLQQCKRLALPLPTGSASEIGDEAADTVQRRRLSALLAQNVPMQFAHFDSNLQTPESFRGLIPMTALSRRFFHLFLKRCARATPPDSAVVLELANYLVEFPGVLFAVADLLPVLSRPWLDDLLRQLPESVTAVAFRRHVRKAVPPRQCRVCELCDRRSSHEQSDPDSATESRDDGGSKTPILVRVLERHPLCETCMEDILQSEDGSGPCPICEEELEWIIGASYWSSFAH